VIQLTVLNGKKAGTEKVARHFPVRIGRTPANDLSLDEPGIWDDHLELDLQSSNGVLLKAHPNALTCVNGHPVEEVLLQAGDLIEIGSVQIRFWLSPTHQYSLRFREAATWIMLGLLCLAQIGLICWLSALGRTN
jgi:pSer/pThr/pTyr-binding forkhead associated (FHA) protein